MMTRRTVSWAIPNAYRFVALQVVEAVPKTVPNAFRGYLGTCVPPSIGGHVPYRTGSNDAD